MTDCQMEDRQTGRFMELDRQMEENKIKKERKMAKRKMVGLTDR